MKKHPVVWFYGLAFAIAWLGWLPVVAGSHGVAPFTHPAFQAPLLLPALGPAVAALIVVWASEGSAGLHRWLQLLGQWRVGVQWWGLALLLPVGVFAVGQVVTQALRLAAPPAPPDVDRVPIVVATLIMAVFANPWEEIGWRGFALPRLQKNHSALTATLLGGGLWGVWHLPLFFWVGNPMSSYPFLPWFLGTVAVTFVYTWLYNSTHGSLWVVTLFHVVGNTVGLLIPGVSFTALALVYGVIAGLLLAGLGKDHLARCERVRAG